jgi:predicted Zn-dependent protease
LFKRLSKEAGESSTYALEFLQSHPLGRGRAERFARAEDKNWVYSPALSEEEFKVLKSRCGD